MKLDVIYRISKSFDVDTDELLDTLLEECGERSPEESVEDYLYALKDNLADNIELFIDKQIIIDYENGFEEIDEITLGEIYSDTVKKLYIRFGIDVDEDEIEFLSKFPEYIL